MGTSVRYSSAVTDSRGRASLASLARLARPVVLAGEQVTEAVPALTGLLPGGGLARGTTTVVAPAAVGGAWSLVLALLAGPSRQGAWCAVAGAPALGLAAAAEAGIDLGRLALVPRPGREWAAVAGALLDGCDVVVVQPPARVGPGPARRLVALARERRSVLMVVGEGAASWPEPPDLRLAVEGGSWQGLGQGHGHLRARLVVVVASGRRSAARATRGQLWLPAPGAPGGTDPWRPSRGAVVAPAQQAPQGSTPARAG